jgi:hypothetical protein
MPGVEGWSGRRELARVEGGMRTRRGIENGLLLPMFRFGRLQPREIRGKALLHCYVHLCGLGGT